MTNTKLTQEDYKIFEGEYQVSLPINTGMMIPENDSVRILNAIFERMRWNIFDACYSRYGRNEYPPRILTKLLVYGYTRHIYSSREIERACRENINFMYLLEGYKAPDHNTIARFRSKIFPQVKDRLMRELVEKLYEMGEIDLKNVFIDGTKIEANAGRYTFVWKKRVLKDRVRVQKKISKELPGMLEGLGIKYHIPEVPEIHHLKKLRKKLGALRKQEQIEFVHGTGKRKSKLQKAWEKVNEWLEKLKRYTKDEHICGQRNSYSKTDHDATFMRMKEDHMRNGQLKPGYNVNVATASEYIIGSYVSSDRTDTKTLIPFAKQLSCYAIERFIVDAGYESEENYCYFEQPWISAKLLVKPTNHEQKKRRKYKTDISRRENMAYDAQTDTYTCANGKPLVFDHIRKTRSSAGFPLETAVYKCSECQGCPLKDKCIKGRSKMPLEQRSKTLYVSKRFTQQREKMEIMVNTSLGKFLRVNRSIQAEGSFAMTKEDMNFRRFLLRGSVKVDAEWTILTMAYDILKLYHKIRTGRLGTHLAVPTAFSRGL